MPAKKPASKPAPLDTQRLFRIGMDLADRIEYAEMSLAPVAKPADVPLAPLNYNFVEFTHYLIPGQEQFVSTLLQQGEAYNAQNPAGAAPGLHAHPVPTQTQPGGNRIQWVGGNRQGRAGLLIRLG